MLSGAQHLDLSQAPGEHSAPISICTCCPCSLNATLLPVLHMVFSLVPVNSDVIPSRQLPYFHAVWKGTPSWSALHAALEFLLVLLCLNSGQFSIFDYLHLPDCKDHPLCQCCIPSTFNTEKHVVWASWAFGEPRLLQNWYFQRILWSFFPPLH